MITIRYGEIEGQEPDGKRGAAVADRPQSIDLEWPDWDITGGPTWTHSVRRHTVPIRGGSYTEILGEDPATFTITLEYIPYIHIIPAERFGEIRTGGAGGKWTEQPTQVALVRGQWVDLLMGEEDMGEWFLYDVQITPGDIGIVPPQGDVPQGMYGRSVEVRLQFLQDIEGEPEEGGTPTTGPDGEIF